MNGNLTCMYLVFSWSLLTNLNTTKLTATQRMTTNERTFGYAEWFVLRGCAVGLCSVRQMTLYWYLIIYGSDLEIKWTKYN